MKRKMIISLAALALTATGCGKTSETTEITKPTETTTATPATEIVTEAPLPETSESASESASESVSEPEPEPIEASLDLSSIQLGWSAKIVQTEIDSYEETTELDAYVVSASDGVVKYEDYYASDEKTKGFEADDLYLKTTTIYEKQALTEGGTELITTVSADLMGKAQYSALKLNDIASGEAVETPWNEAFIENAFSFLTVDDFEKQEDGTYSLVFDAAKKNDSRFAKAYYGLNHDIYPVVYSNYSVTDSYFKRDALDITSFTLTVDEHGVPTGFNMSLENQTQYYSTITRSYAGTFTMLGADSASKWADGESKYPEVDAILEKLRAENFKFQAYIRIEGDGWFTSDTAVSAAGSFDGKNTLLLNKINGTTATKYGYQKVDDDHYRTFTDQGSYSTKYVYDSSSDSPTSGSLIGDVVPEFKFGSYIFEKTSDAVEGASTYGYKINIPTLVSGSYYSSIYLGYKLCSYSASLNGTLVVIDSDSIRFTYYGSDRIYDIRYYDFGKVAEFSDTITEPSA